LSDIVTTSEAKRLYGVIGLGGVCGGLFGAFFVATTVTKLGRENILLMCVIPMALIAVIVWLVNQQVEKEHASTIGMPAHPECTAASEGIQILLESKYLLAIAGMVIFYELISSIIDFQLSATVETKVLGSVAKTAYFSQIAIAQGFVSVFAQLFVTSYVMRKFGVGTALLILPVAILMGSVGYLIFANLLFVTVLSVSDNSLSYSVNQSAREILYVPTSRCTKYKAKAIIDMSIQRFAKVLAVLVNLAAAWYLSLENIRWLSLACLTVLLLWVAVIRYADRNFQQLTAEAEATA
ncbi:MAG TPA: Npt1/Npt2 family nucleotide transporter, partial [Acidobacteriota bacterium]|nr:Npt1/Npt2 family nucleotide transporter [Acidobacteriota bacterium]